MRTTTQPLGGMQIDLLGHLQDSTVNDVWHPAQAELRMWGSPSAVNRLLIGLERRGLVAHVSHGGPSPYPAYVLTLAGLNVDTKG